MLDQTSECGLLSAFRAFLQHHNFQALREAVHATGLVCYGPVIEDRDCVVYLRAEPAVPVVLGTVPHTYNSGW